MQSTGVFATPEEIEKLKQQYYNAEKTPVIALSVAHGLRTGGFSGEAWTALYKACHRVALDHGLPEIEGYYGCDLETGEFVKT